MLVTPWLDCLGTEVTVATRTLAGIPKAGPLKAVVTAERRLTRCLIEAKLQF